MYSPRTSGSQSLRFASATTGCVLALMLAGCSSNDEPVKITPAQSASAAQAGAAAKAAAAMSGNATARPDAGANPHAGGMGGLAAGGAATSGAALQFAVPEGWTVQIPTSSMRKAQFKLPKAEGDAEDAELVLFYFGGEGGSKEANFERWSGYFTPAGATAPRPLERTTRTVNGMEVTEAFASGTLDTGQVQGMGPGQRENWSMLVAYVESPSGPYFARLLGPGNTVSRWEASFRQWISSLKPTSG